MRRIAIGWIALLGMAMTASAQQEKEPAVILKMRELGTVYVTYTQTGKGKTKGAAPTPKIIGIDFRPMGGTDPTKVASLVKELSTLPDLQTILLLGNDVSDDAVAALPTAKNLVKIQFFNTSVTDKGIANLSRFTGLQHFSFTGSGLTDEGMKIFAKLRFLRRIEIIDAKITDKGLGELRGMRRLQELTIENTDATVLGLEMLRKELIINQIDFRNI